MHINCLRVLLYACLVHTARTQCPYTDCTCEIHEGRSIIDCSGLDLTEVPASKATDLQFDELLLSDNALSTLSGGVFRHVPIRKLDLSQNFIRNISHEAFDGLSERLEVLMLGLGSDAEFPSEAIVNLTRLKTLAITGYGRPSLPHNALDTLRNLEVLSLDNGGLQVLSAEDVHSQNESLTSLSLRHNHFMVIPDALMALRNLRALNLASNSIDVVPNQAFPSLKQLDLSQNGISSFHTDSLHNSHNTLQVLQLSHCLLTEQRLTALKTLTQLRQLDLSHNKLARIPDGLFTAMSHLQNVDLRENNIVLLENGTFRGLSATTVLNLKSNKLRDVESGSFHGLSSLRELYLDGQNLSAILTDLSFFQGIEETLEELSLRNVNFSPENWQALKTLTNIRLIAMATNNITRIPHHSFLQWRHLHTLDLSENLISDINGVFSGLEGSLETILLNANNISTVDRCTFFEFDHLSRINLAQNPLQCDCQLLWLAEWMQQHYSEFERLTLSWRCANGDLFRYLTVDDFTCLENVTQAECVTTTLPPPTTTTPLATTTTQITTVTTAASNPPRILYLNATNITDTSVLVKWAVSESVSGFTLVYHMTGDNQPTHSVQYNAESRSARLMGLVPERAYNVCIRVHADHACTTFTTLSAVNLASATSSADWQVILGVVFAVVACLCIIAVVFCYVKHRRHQTAKPAFADRLRVAYDSKRFSRPTRTRIDLDNVNNQRVERKLNELGDDECGQCAARGVSTASTDRYVPELPPRNELGYMNPVSLEDEHIYTEISETSVSHM